MATNSSGIYLTLSQLTSLRCAPGNFTLLHFCIAYQEELMANFVGNDDKPHLRFNPLKDEWIVVSPHRTKRPWKGQTEKPQEETIPRRDLRNPLVPSAVRASGATNPEYSGVFVFKNDFPALLEDESPANGAGQTGEHELLRSAKAEGTCRVMCFHPWSDMILPLMDTKDVVKVIEEWINQFSELSKKYRWVQVRYRETRATELFQSKMNVN